MTLTNLDSKGKTGFCLNPENQLERRLFKYVLTAIILLFVIKGFSTTYYVSSNGNDGNAGTSENTPWKTLTKVNSFTPKPGDQILFKRGDEWSGSITAKASGTSGSLIVYGAYGTGDKPKIYGSEKISGWTLHSGNIYKAIVDETDITQLFLDGERMLLARYPDAGYFNTTNVTNKTTFTSTDLSGAINYRGATWIGRDSRFTMYSKTVTGSSSQTITINSAPVYQLGVGKGFFLCNKLEFLTQAGEWYYDNAANTLYLWTPNGGSPSGYEIRVSTADYGISITDKSYITIQNLEISQSAETGVYLSNGDYITVDGCNIVSPDMFGVHAPTSASTNLTVTNTYIYQANSAGIRSFSPSSTYTDNTIEDTGLHENINKRTNTTADNFGTAIFLRESNNSIIQYNRIINSGYCGINFRGTNVMVKYNYVDGACLVLNDGGGIYTYTMSYPTASSGSEVMYNIVTNVHGNQAGYAASLYGEGYGIYFDAGSTNIDIKYNTVFTTGGGIFLNVNNNILVQYNTLFDNLAGFRIDGEAGDSYIYDNIVYGTDRIGTFVWWANSYQRLQTRSSSSPIYDRNTYIQHSATTPFLASTTFGTFAEWKSATGQDANSTFDGTRLGEGEIEMLFYNETKQTKKINLGNSVYRDLNRKQISGTLTLEPFTSKILIKTKSAINPDIELPKISSFTIPSTATSLTIPIATLSATDNIAVTGFKLTETSTSPNSGDAGWNTVAPNSYTFSSEGTKTLYAWVKDAAGNVSASMSDHVVITLPDISDITKPTITAFLISSTATSLTIPISSFSAIDNIAVAGYILTETSIAPNAGGNGWNTVAPISYTFTSEGNKTIYAWVKDAAGNVSSSMNDQVVINLPDVTKPVVTAFSVPETSSSLVVPVNSCSATDNIAIIGFKLTENSTVPNAGDTGWNTVAPTSYTFTSEGTKTLYVWVKDAAGNVSASMSDQVVINLPDKTKPVINAFSIPETSSAFLVPVSSFSANDNIAVTGFKLTETSAAPNAADAGWNTVAPNSYTFTSEGNKTIYAWVKDAAGNVSVSLSDQVVINLPDKTKPVVNAFSIPETSSSRTIPVSIFSATDNIAVTGFKLTETSTAPNAGDAVWNTVAPTSYTFTSEGTKTLYAWVKDAAGNVSGSISKTVIITISDKSSTFSEYLFEENTGTTVYDSKGLNNGTIINEELRGTGVVGNGLTFTGSGYINLGHSFGENVENEVSLSVWIKPNTLTGNYQGIIMHGGLNTDSYALYIRPDSKEIAFKTSGTTSSWVAVDNVNDLWDGNWHHIVVTYNGSEKVIYLDNVALVKIGATGKIESGAGYNLLIGAGRDEVLPTLLYKGLIDEVRIYNYAITISQIGELHNLNIQKPDITSPIISLFTIQETSSSLTVPVSSFSATDNIAVTGFKLTETSTAPNSGDAGWNTVAPTSYTFTSEGTKILYAWAKDAAGNVSASMSAIVEIELTKPVVTAFSIPDTTESLTVPIIKFEVNDKNIVTGYLISEISNSPVVNDAGWTSSAPATYSFTGDGSANLTTSFEQSDSDSELKSGNTNSNIFNNDVTKTLYAWTKDACGNISTGVSDKVVISIPDVTKPEVISFNILSTSASLVVEISSFTASDNKAVTGFMLTETSAAPKVVDAGWNTDAPTSYTFTSEGNKTLYAWAKDAAGNVSASISDQVVINMPDKSQTFSEYLFEEYTGTTVYDSKGSNNGTIINEELRGIGVIGNGLTFTGSGYINLGHGFGENVQNEVTLSAWVKPSAMKGDYQGIIMHGGPNTDSYALYIRPDSKEIGFKTSGTTSSWVAVNNVNDLWNGNWHHILVTYNGSEKVIYLDNVVLIKIGATGKIESGAGYNLLIGAGRDEVLPTLLYKGLIDEVRIYNYAITSSQIDELYNLDKQKQDITSPTITLFSISETSSSITVPVISFSATDNIAVIGFKLTETSTTPNAGDAGWNTDAPTSYTFTSEGTKTLYAWVKDAAGNVSASMSDQVVINLPDETKPVVTAFTIPETSSSLIVPVNSFTATDNISVTGYILTETFTAPNATDAGWNTVAPTSYTFTSEGTKTLYTWVKDAAGNVSACISDQVVITMPDKSQTFSEYLFEEYTGTTVYDSKGSNNGTIINEELRGIGVIGNGLTFTGSGYINLGHSFGENVQNEVTLSAWVKPSAMKGDYQGIIMHGGPNTDSYALYIRPDSKEIAFKTSGTTSSWVAVNNVNDLWDGNWHHVLVTYNGSEKVIYLDNVVLIKIGATGKIESGAGYNLLIGTGRDEVLPTLLYKGLIDEVRIFNYALTSSQIGELYNLVKQKQDITSPTIPLFTIQETSSSLTDEEQTYTQSISLKKGWNIFSSYLIPANHNMESIMETQRIQGKLIKVQDEVNQTYEQLSSQTGWINNIGNLQKTEGYKICVSSSCSLEIKGLRIPLPLNIEIKQGWNLISFPINGSMNAMQVVQPLIDAGILEKVQDQKGNSIENWRNRGWINGIGNFNAGEGYIVKSNKNGILVMDETISNKSGVFIAERMETTYFKVNYEGNGIDHMNINIVELHESYYQVGDEIAVFDGKICVGAVKLTDMDINNNAVSIPASASDLNGTNGFVNGNDIELKVWKNESNEEVKLLPNIIEGNMIFNKQASVFVLLNNQSTNVSDEFNNLKIDMYPNPATDKVTVRFSNFPVAGTKLMLMDVTGKVIVARDAQSTLEILNIENLSAGMYLVKTEFNNNFQIQKLIKR